MAQQTLNNGELGNVWRGKVNDNFTELYGLSGTKTKIEDAAQTTGLYTEETADTLVGHSAGTGTAVIFEMFSGATSVFQVDGNGALLNDGSYMVHKANATSVCIGTITIPASVSGTNNTFIGRLAGSALTSGSGNTVAGAAAGDAISTASNNALFGLFAGSALSTTTIENTMIGSYSGASNQGSNNVFLGNNSGRYQIAVSNTFLVNSIDRTNAANELTRSLMYGTFNATASSQTLNVNAYQTIYTDSGELTTIGLKIEQAGAGDAKLSFALTGVKNYSMGIDNSTTNDDFILSFTTTLTTNPIMTVDGSSLDVTFVNDVIADNFTAEEGELVLKETTTPSAVTNYGKIYTKTDNKLYFQDGAGVEHLIVIEDTSGDVVVTGTVTATNFILA